MQLLKRWRIGRGLVGLGAGVLLIAGLAMPAAAATQQFNANIVGGLITIGTTSNNLGGGPQCSDGLDNEYDAPFTPTKDTLVDYPADPECVTPFDNDEKTAGFQLATPLSLSGTIDDATGNFTVPPAGLTFPDSTLTLSSPLVVFVANSASADANITGNMAPGGTVTVSSLDLSFRIKLCIPAFGCTNPPAPYGTGPAWSAACIVDINPPNVTSADPAGSGYFAAAGVTTVADTDYTLPVPTDDSPPGAIPCAGLAGSFGLPDPNADIALQLSTNKFIGQAKSVTVGNGTVAETGPNVLTGKPGTSKITFPVTLNTAPLVDMTIPLSTAGFGATESQKPAIPNTDFASLDGKVLKIKAGKTSGKVSVTVYSDANVEGDELMLLTLGTPSDPTYTVVHGTALGTIKDVAAANKVSVYGGDTSEGSNPGVSPTKPLTVTAAFPLIMSTQQLTDTTVTYCVMPVTATPTVNPPGPAITISDYTEVSCAAPKTKLIKAGKLTSSVAVKVNQDATSEPDEALAVVILNVTGSAASANSAASAGVGQIKTDD